jgi:hypothetical protein
MGIRVGKNSDPPGSKKYVSGMGKIRIRDEKIRIRDEKNSDLRSGINIPDLQHCFHMMTVSKFITIELLSPLL